MAADVLDLGNLVLVESNDLDIKETDSREERERKIKDSARDNAQVLLERRRNP